MRRRRRPGSSSPGITLREAPTPRSPRPTESAHERTLRMSGIAGVLHFDGRDVARRDLERAANALRAHGPDRSDMVVAGRVGLVHVLMRMTPEDHFDRQPYRAASGALIAADIRLD